MLVSENLQNFERGKEPKTALDVGRERSDNPNNLSNTSSYRVDITNSEYLSNVLQDLQEFHMTLHHDLNPDQLEAKPGEEPPEHPMTNRLRNRMDSIENELEALDDLLKSIKR